MQKTKGMFVVNILYIKQLQDTGYIYRWTTSKCDPGRRDMRPSFAATMCT